MSILKHLLGDHEPPRLGHALGGPEPTPTDWDNVTLTARKIGHLRYISDEQLRQAEEDRRADEEAGTRWNAATREQRAEWTRQRDEQRAAEKTARTCTHCGCDPDEHGGY